MRQYVKALTMATCIVALVFCFGCGGGTQVKDDTGAGTGTSTQTSGSDRGIGEGELVEKDVDASQYSEIDDASLQAVFADITFDYDDFSLKPSAKETLKGIAEWLLKNTSTQILIEGHCDERGTNEYNLALGERRANSAKKYLVQLGVARNRIATISYGEEKPADPGHTEAAWAKNRRCHFLTR